MIAVAADAKQSMVQALSNRLSGGSLILFGGTRPAFGVTGLTVLSTAALPVPLAQSTTGGTLVFNAFGEVLASGDGTVTWARIIDSSGATVIDMDAGADVDLVDLVIQSDANPESATVFTGGSINISEFSIGV